MPDKINWKRVLFGAGVGALVFCVWIGFSAGTALGGGIIGGLLAREIDVYIIKNM